MSRRCACWRENRIENEENTFWLNMYMFAERYFYKSIYKKGQKCRYKSFKYNDMIVEKEDIK